ncbi:MAG: hypothetical protein ACFFDN_36980 [Candidatus Hodarchaeota archaeon]
MTESKRIISSRVKVFPKYTILDEKEKRTKKKVRSLITLKHRIDPAQKQRNEKKWKESIGYYHLNPEKFKFGLKDLK